MAEFVWEARGRTGEVRSGKMEAESEDAVNQRLRAQQLSPTKVKKKGREFSFQLGSGVSLKDIVTHVPPLHLLDPGLDGGGRRSRRAVLDGRVERRC